MRQLILLFIFASLWQISCQNQEKSETVQLKFSPNSYTLFTKGQGTKMQDGEVLSCKLRVTTDTDSVLVDNYQEVDDYDFRVTHDTTLYAKNPIYEVLSNLVEGDSVVFTRPLNPQEKFSPNFRGVSSLTFEIKVMKSWNAEELEVKQKEDQAKQEALIEEMSVKSEEVATKLAGLLADYKANKLGDRLIKTTTGLEYVMDIDGTGTMPQQGDKVDVHYYGVFKSSGEMFDNSYNRGRFFTFAVGQGQVIPGWDEALQLMKKGSSGVFFIPYNLAYGDQDRGKIPGKSDLVFYIEYP